MKKFNLFNEIITVKTSELQSVIDSNKEFAINIDGEICYKPFTGKDILIFSGLAQKNKDLEKALGNKYQLVVSEDRVLIKAFSNWQGLIEINTPQASYDDTTADGVAEFSNKDIEEIGWQATEFNFSYRELVEVLEEKAQGITLCIEQEEPYQFSGFGFITNNDEAKDILYAYCKDKIKVLLETEDDFKAEYLEDDQIAAKEFFGL